MLVSYGWKGEGEAQRGGMVGLKDLLGCVLFLKPGGLT